MHDVLGHTQNSIKNLHVIRVKVVGTDNQRDEFIHVTFELVPEANRRVDNYGGQGS